MQNNTDKKIMKIMFKNLQILSCRIQCRWHISICYGKGGGVDWLYIFTEGTKSQIAYMYSYVYMNDSYTLVTWAYPYHLGVAYGCVIMQNDLGRVNWYGVLQQILRAGHHA